MQVRTMLVLRKRENNIFFTLPKEIIDLIGQVYQDSNSDIAKALHHAAYARQDNVKALIEMLEQNPRLLLETGNVITPGGLDVRQVTIYEFLLGAGDPRLAKKVEPYFENILNDKNEPIGENERKHQYARYRPLIDKIPTQVPEDLTWLLEIIKESSAEDVVAELATGDNYESYQSPLRTALSQFREAKLDPNVRIMTKPRMHCNYQNLIHAYNMVDAEWDNLLKTSEHNYNKIYLVVREIIGLIELLELTGFERCLLARGQLGAAAMGKEIERSNKYKYGSDSFPDFDGSLVDSHTGVGFESFVSIEGAEVKSWRRLQWGGEEASPSTSWLWGAGLMLQNSCKTKTLELQSLCNTPMRENTLVLR